MNPSQIIENTENFVKERLKGAEAGHDWFHIQRVLRLTKSIGEEEKVDLFVAQLGALLHDIADSKFHHGDETIGPAIARDFLQTQQVSDQVTDHVVNIINFISFKGGNEKQSFSSPELEVIQDADRLDAIGAIGIARAFNYGGYKNRLLYDPNIKPNLHLSKKEYKTATSPTINHFYEKLLRLKDRMNTRKGRQIAEERHLFMLQFLDQFYKEWRTEI